MDAIHFKEEIKLNEKPSEKHLIILYKIINTKTHQFYYQTRNKGGKLKNFYFSSESDFFSG